MTKYEINGREVKVGDFMETRDGQKAIISFLYAGNDISWVIRGIVLGQSCGSEWLKDGRYGSHTPHSWDLISHWEDKCRCTIPNTHFYSVETDKTTCIGCNFEVKYIKHYKLSEMWKIWYKNPIDGTIGNYLWEGEKEFYPKRLDFIKLAITKGDAQEFFLGEGL